MKLYITNLSLWALIFFYAPIVLWLMWRIWRNSRLRVVEKTLALFSAVLLAYAIPLGDVTVNSIAMAKACPSAGLQIYKTAEVEGFVGRYGLRDVPYQFIEFPKQRVDGTDYWIRYERNPDGSISEKSLDQPTAEYEVIYEQWHVDRGRDVETSRYSIRNRLSGELLAEWNLFNPIPGWLDRTLVVRWFGAGGRDGCHGDPAYGFESRVLIPSRHDQ